MKFEFENLKEIIKILENLITSKIYSLTSISNLPLNQSMMIEKNVIIKHSAFYKNA